MIKRLFKWTVALAASTALMGVAPAMADPLTIGSAVAAGLFSTTGISITSVPVLSAIGSTLIAGASIGAQVLLGALNRPKAPEPQDFQKNSVGSNNESERRGVGRCRAGGPFAFRNTKGLESYRMPLHCRGPIDGFERFFIGKREVIVDPQTGVVESPPWRTASEVRCRWETSVGNPNPPAWPALIAAFPDIWTADHTLDGIAHSRVLFTSPGIQSEDFVGLNYTRSIDDLSVILRGEPVYDPRDQTTSFSENGILVAVHILLSDGSFNNADIWWEKIRTEADKADVLVNCRTGVRPRATAAGMWLSEQPRGQALAECLRSIGAEIVISDTGLIGIALIDDTPSASVTIEADDIISENEAFGPESAVRPNVVRLRYQDRDRNFEMTEVPLLKADGITPLDWSWYPQEIEAVGRQVSQIDLPFCTDPYQAQRIARRLFEYERANKGLVTANYAGMLAWNQSVINIEFDELGDDDTVLTVKCRIAEPTIDDEQGIVEIPFLAVPDLSVWNPAVDEAAPLPPLPDFGYESELDTPNVSPGLALVQYRNGDFELRVQMTPVADATGAECVYRTFDGDIPTFFTAMNEQELWLAYVSVGDVTGKRIEAKYRFSDDDDNISNFSPDKVVGSIAVINPALNAPNVSVTTLSDGTDVFEISGFAVTASYVRVVRTEENGSTTQLRIEDVRPGQTVTVPFTPIQEPGEPRLHTITQHSSNGVASAPVTFTL